MPKASVILDEKQQTGLKILLMDEDGEAALVFLKEVIWSQLQDARRKEMHSHLDMGVS